MSFQNNFGLETISKAKVFIQIPLSQVNPTTGRVHTNYGQAIASTGRLSSTEPNLQNIPIRTDEGENQTSIHSFRVI